MEKFFICTYMRIFRTWISRIAFVLYVIYYFEPLLLPFPMDSKSCPERRVEKGVARDAYRTLYSAFFNSGGAMWTG